MSKSTRTIKTGGDTGRISREDVRAATLAASKKHDRGEWAAKYAEQAVRWLGEPDDNNIRWSYFEGQFRYAMLGVDPFDGSREAVEHAQWSESLMADAREETTDWLMALPPDVRATVPGGLMWWLHGAQTPRSRPATPEEIAWLRETGALE
jgi:hypothetical protein